VAVYSQAAAIITKGAATVALIATDLVITGVPAGSVTVGDTTFDYPQSTETVKGVAEIATDAEVTAGTDNERIVTPAKLAARYVKKSGDTMTGALTAPSFVGPLTGNVTGTSSGNVRQGGGVGQTTNLVYIGWSAASQLCVQVDSTDFGSNWPINVAGNSNTASTLLTARTISLGGDLSGSASFNGSANVTINATVARATETVNGVTEIATDAEVIAGTDNERIVTPAKLAARYVKKSGDTMTGALTLPGDPASALHAATKQYVDNLLVGVVAGFSRTTAPAGWLKANGAAISRNTYSALFATIGTTYGAGDGSTTFNLPDARGEFIRGVDDGRGIDAGRALGSSQIDTLQNITGTVGQFDAAFSNVVATGAFTTTQVNNTTGGGGSGKYLTANFDASRVARTSAETRPRNIALLYCIKF